ncbi:outer membrane beta-barrel protein [Rhizobiaceae bacterium BDR2-2]|uniref:Outer membrane beta-barrel protein n=1 Tax=Ectorhizobium quercum TaxID=2965071 RepID=A0AAE3N104_9HYPH|nr:outer membrane beta-barrel protein [Ectorhizobium quercum]MCX8996827.1 outer membrane beta-barrel protein [Ectorhizobium quercum]
MALAVVAFGIAVAPGMRALAQSADAEPAATAAIADDDQMTRFGSTGDAIEGRINAPEAPMDGAGAANRDDGEATGVRLGGFVLRPSLQQSIKGQKTTNGDRSERRTYLETGIRGTLTSDWSRHELSLNGESILQKNLKGDLSTDPASRLDAALRLDLPAETTATVTGSYAINREDNDDPNAIPGASAQSDVQTLTGGLALQRNLGRIRGLIGVDVERTTYSSVRLSDGTRLDLSDRDRNAYGIRGRLGYELSPALVPFLEASFRKTVYDSEQDANGFRRSSDSYAMRSGVEVDLGEKLRGEIGIGYETVSYDDTRLTEVSGLTLDGRLNWSPRRGTNVAAGLSTLVEDSTAPGESGGIVYRFNSEIAHELRDDLVARLSGATTWRRYPSGSLISNSTTYAAGTGLTYKVNRYLELNGSLDYEWTRREAGSNSSDLTAGVGLTLKR